MVARWLVKITVYIMEPPYYGLVDAMYFIVLILNTKYNKNISRLSIESSWSWDN